MDSDWPLGKKSRVMLDESFEEFERELAVLVLG